MLYTDTVQLMTSSTSASSRVVIIGSGAVGLYAASLLATHGRDVLVIEAGGSHLGSFSGESYVSVGRTHEGIRLARGCCLGGTTNLWGGQLVEFQPIDFMGRPWLAGSAWPVSYDEIAPYYALTYRNLGLVPELHRDENVWRGVKSPPPQIGTDFEVFLTRWLKVPNFAQMFARQIQGEQRLAVLTGHTVVGFRGFGGRIDAVRVVDGSGQSHWIEGGTFILAAGTIENSRLLLHAADEPHWQCPWRHNQNVGRWFQDHLGGRVGVMRPRDKRAFFNMFCTIVYGGNKFQPKIRMHNEVLEREQILNVQGLFAFESKASEHLVYLKQFLKAAVFSRKLTGLGDLFRNGAGAVRYLVPLMWKYLKDHRVFVPNSAKIILNVQAEHAPCADSRINIDRTSVDSHGLPRVVLNWRLGGDELTSIRQFAVRLTDAMESAGIGTLEIDEDLLSLNPRFLAKLWDTYHQAGGTVMGWSEQDGVVDRNQRVFGTDNLYVGGASVFRTTSNANVTFTALALTTRLVDHLSAGGSAQAPAAQPSRDVVPAS